MQATLLNAAQTNAQPRRRRPRIVAQLASTDAEIMALQKLRYQIFAEEMGADLHSDNGLDCDNYDAYCDHLIVLDTDSNQIIGGTRLLPRARSHFTDGFYSASEFNMDAILQLEGSILEVGRTCIHPDYRNGATIAILWSQLAKYTQINQFDYMIGCASIGLEDGGYNAAKIMEKIRAKHLSPEHLRVTPKHDFAVDETALSPSTEKVTMPPLLKAYLNLGAYVCGEPCLDSDFNVVDVFILLELKLLNHRYARHFLDNPK